MIFPLLLNLVSDLTWFYLVEDFFLDVKIKSLKVFLFFHLQEAEKKQEEERIRMENILSGNPLLNYSAAGQKGDLKVVHLWIYSTSLYKDKIEKISNY